jgi:hypothetical protein
MYKLRIRLYERKDFFKIRLYFTATIAMAMWALLAWNHYHGGVPSHHILANEELPAISKGWGAVLLPLLTWFLLYRIQKRALGNKDGCSQASNFFVRVIYGLASSLSFGILLSAFFTFGYADICGYMILGLIPHAIFFPIYRAECLLGFVMGMTFTFGAVLPTGIGIILGLMGLVLYLSMRAGILYTRSKFT